MVKCTNETLESFSKQHFTYINQVFGDLTVREIIQEIFPNDEVEFAVEETGIEFENTFHHILKYKKKAGTVCSVDSKYQNINVNVNDTLCQSYSLMNYFGIKISKSQKKRQMDMIDMYRQKLLSNDKFIEQLDDVIHKGNSKLWIDFTKKGKNGKRIYIPMNKAAILEKIHQILADWKGFGYHFFIGDGKCPPEKEPKSKTAKIMKNPESKSKTIKQVSPVKEPSPLSVKEPSLLPVKEPSPKKRTKRVNQVEEMKGRLKGTNQTCQVTCIVKCNKTKKLKSTAAVKDIVE